jgi:copper chaperone CopZ
MKNAGILTLCMLSIVFMINTGCKSKSKANSYAEISIKVDTFCEKGKAKIEEALSKEEGVIAVKAHLRKQIVTINYDSTKVNKDKLVAALEKSGFKTEFTKPGTIINKSCSEKGKE